MRPLLITCAVALLLVSAAMTGNGEGGGRAIEFPDVPGYLTLKTDLHIHTVFSDGSVWPNIRVQEAIRDGLDAIAMTDHLEYQPHADDIPHPNRNRSYDIAAEAVGDSSLIVIRGAEITRSMPPGHSNAIFLNDANPLLQDDAVTVFREAAGQGAFNFWNHPHWTSQRPDGVATLTGLHRQLLGENILHGIEVANNTTYSDEALQIALDHNLTILATSDIHGLIDWQYDVPNGGHRPVTLVFAAERSLAGIAEALKARRTVAWFNNLLVGREEHLQPLLKSCLKVEEASYLGDSSALSVVIDNVSDADFILDNKSPYTLHNFGDVVTLKAHRKTAVSVKTLDRKTSASLRFEVLNAVTAPNTHPELALDLTIPQPQPAGL